MSDIPLAHRKVSRPLVLLDMLFYYFITPMQLNTARNTESGHTPRNAIDGYVRIWFLMEGYRFATSVDFVFVDFK